MTRIEALEAQGRSLRTERTLIDVDAEFAHLSSEMHAAFEADFEAVCKECGFDGKEELLSRYERKGPDLFEGYPKIVKCLGRLAARSY